MTQTDGDAGTLFRAIGIKHHARTAFGLGVIHREIGIRTLGEGIVSHGNDKVGLAIEGASRRSRLLGMVVMQPALSCGVTW
jgi:hypothetical protein